METDDGIRSSIGVVSCLRELGDGKLRIVLDDVTNEKRSTAGPWKHHVLFIWNDFQEQEINDLTVSEKELAEFGFNVLARLVALRKHPSSK